MSNEQRTVEGSGVTDYDSRTTHNDAHPVTPSPVHLLHGLVAIPSVSTDEASATAWLVDQMAQRGFRAFVDEAGNAVGIVGEGVPQTVLLGHIDTVAGTIPVRVEDSKLYGRGAVDAKGPLATFVSAAAELVTNGPIQGQIVVLGCVEEESPSSKGAHFAVKQYRPDWCIVGEPSDWQRVTLGYKGALRLECSVAVPCSHSAHARTTAAEQLVAFWNRVAADAAAFNHDRRRAFDQLTPALLAFNTTSDGITDHATAAINIRLPVGIDPDAITAQYRAYDSAVVIETLGACAAFETERTSPLVRTLTRAIRAQGVQPALVVKTGTADMNVVGPAWQCPIVAYGPGDAALDHTPDEHIVIADYLRAIDVLNAALRELHRSH